MEVEAKFRVSDQQTLVRLETAPALAGYDLEAGEGRSDRDTFLDTAERAFLAHGYFLRRRETADGIRMTLKQLLSDESGLLSREEFEMLVAVDVPVSEWPRSELRARVEEIAGGRPLEALITLQQARVTRRVLKNGAEVAELSLDIVLVDAHRGEQAWCEAEVEARAEGIQADVEAIAWELRERWGLTPEARPKFVRALELAGLSTEAEAAEAAAVEAGAAAREPGAGQSGAGEGASGEEGRLFGPAERRVHEEVAAQDGSLARRARALLELDRGANQAEAGVQATLSARRVRYWLARYRRDGLAIYGPATGVGPGAEPAAARHAAARVTEDDGVPPVAAAEDLLGSGAGRLAKRPAISRDDTMTEAAAKTLRLHLAKMLAHEEGTRLGEDIEDLHDMRVATRRMRMALRVFAAHLDPEVMRPVLKGLRRTGRTLGAVRDLDVFGEKTRRYLDGLPPERAGDLDGLLVGWQAERERQRERMARYLDGPKYHTFVERILELLEAPVEHLAPRRFEARPQRVSQVLPGVLYEDMGLVWAFDGQLGGLETPLPRFHALRIACKGLRYTLEFFEEVLGPGARPLIKSVKGMQDHLGDLQDGVVTTGILRDHLTWGTWRHSGHRLPGPTEVVIAPGAAQYLAARQEEMERLVLSFPDVWPTVGGSAFSKGLATLIAGI